MCEECFGVPYEKIVADRQHPLRFGLLYSTHTPDLQNVKPLTLEDAKALLEKLNQDFPELAKWRASVKDKFLTIDFAEIEKRFLARLESVPDLAGATKQGVLFSWLWRNAQATEPAAALSGGVEPELADLPAGTGGKFNPWPLADGVSGGPGHKSSHSSPTNHEPASGKV